MSEPLHQSNLSEILDRTIDLYRSSLPVFLGIAAIPTAAILLIVTGWSYLLFSWAAAASRHASFAAKSGTSVTLLFIALPFVVLPLTTAAAALGTAAMNHAATLALMNQRISVFGAYSEALERGWLYIWLFALRSLMTWGGPIVGLIVMGLILDYGAALARFLGLGASALPFAILAMALVLVVLFCYSIWMLLRLALAFPACVVEQMGAWESLKYSASLGKKSRWRIFLLYLLGIAINWLLLIGTTVLPVLGILFFPGRSNAQHQQTVYMVIALAICCGVFAVQAITRPVYGIAQVIFYYDQRMRREGYDMERTMEVAGLIEPEIYPSDGDPEPVDDSGEFWR